MEFLPAVTSPQSGFPFSYNRCPCIHSTTPTVLHRQFNFNPHTSPLHCSYNESSSSSSAPIIHQGLENLPISMDLEQISSESQFDRVVAEAQQLEESVVVLWMASWCRKCIYLKPKLEKLASDYYPSVRFYSVDVNNVPHKLVARAGVTKMPTVQLWRDGKKQGEVIGGHKAHLVVNEVRQMIENEGSI